MRKRMLKCIQYWWNNRPLIEDFGRQQKKWKWCTKKYNSWKWNKRIEQHSVIIKTSICLKAPAGRILQPSCLFNLLSILVKHFTLDWSFSTSTPSCKEECCYFAKNMWQWMCWIEFWANFLYLFKKLDNNKLIVNILIYNQWISSPNKSQV